MEKIAKSFKDGNPTEFLESAGLSEAHCQGIAPIIWGYLPSQIFSTAINKHTMRRGRRDSVRDSPELQNQRHKVRSYLEEIQGDESG